VATARQVRAAKRSIQKVGPDPRVAVRRAFAAAALCARASDERKRLPASLRRTDEVVAEENYSPLQWNQQGVKGGQV
jgi:hypothetical protein